MSHTNAFSYLRFRRIQNPFIRTQGRGESVSAYAEKRYRPYKEKPAVAPAAAPAVPPTAASSASAGKADARERAAAEARSVLRICYSS